MADKPGSNERRWVITLAVFLWLATFSTTSLQPTPHPVQYAWAEKDHGYSLIVGFGAPCWWFSEHIPARADWQAQAERSWVNDTALCWTLGAALWPAMVLLVAWTRLRCPRWRWQNWAGVMMLIPSVAFFALAGWVAATSRMPIGLMAGCYAVWRHLEPAHFALGLTLWLGTALIWEQAPTILPAIRRQWRIYRARVAVRNHQRSDVDVSGTWDQAPRG